MNLRHDHLAATRVAVLVLVVAPVFAPLVAGPSDALVAGPAALNNGCTTTACVPLAWNSTGS